MPFRTTVQEPPKSGWRNLVSGSLRPRRDVPVPLQPPEPVDGHREVQARRHHVLHRRVDRGAECALRRLALGAALLVLPLLPGEEERDEPIVMWPTTGLKVLIGSKVLCALF